MAFSTYFNNGILNGFITIFSKFIYKSLSPMFKGITKRLFKIKENRILFYSVPDYSDNARALYDYMVKEEYEKKYELVWLVSNPKNQAISKKIKGKSKLIRSVGRFHKLYTFRSLYYSMTAKYIFVTHGSTVYDDYKNDEQIVVNLWHGCGYKQKTKELDNMKIKPHSDYYLLPGNLFVDPKSKFWNTSPENLLTLGYPRYDLFFENSINAQRYIEKLKDDNETKVIIWMPTFRQSIVDGDYPESELSSDTSLPLLTSEKQIIDFNHYCFNQNIKVIIKKHPLQKDIPSLKKSYSNLIFIDDNDLQREDVQLYELLSLTDALISDYSSITIDYLLLDRPIAFILDDFDDYKSKRGFVFENPKDFMPGHHVYEVKELYHFVSEIKMGIDDNKERRKQVMKVAHNRSSHYSKSLLDYLTITPS